MFLDSFAPMGCAKRRSPQEWTSGPDRYQITQGSEPEWGWTRLFTFFAYAASKYHVLETTKAPLAQKASLSKTKLLCGWPLYVVIFGVGVVVVRNMMMI